MNAGQDRPEARAQNRCWFVGGDEKADRRRSVMQADGQRLGTAKDHPILAGRRQPPSRRIFNRTGCGQVESARETVEEISPPAQHLDHAGRDRAVRGQPAGDE